VLISYSVQTWSAANSYLVGRLLIDGAEDPRFRVISSGGVEKSIVATLPVYLSRGRHSVKLQFRSSAPIRNIEFQDWNQAYVQINYLWSKPPNYHQLFRSINDKHHESNHDFSLLSLFSIFNIFCKNELQSLRWTFESEFDANPGL